MTTAMSAKDTARLAWIATMGEYGWEAAFHYDTAEAQAKCSRHEHAGWNLRMAVNYENGIVPAVATNVTAESTDHEVNGTPT